MSYGISYLTYRRRRVWLSTILSIHYPVDTPLPVYITTQHENNWRVGELKSCNGLVEETDVENRVHISPFNLWNLFRAFRYAFCNMSGLSKHLNSYLAVCYAFCRPPPLGVFYSLIVSIWASGSSPPLQSLGGALPLKLSEKLLGNILPLPPPGQDKGAEIKTDHCWGRRGGGWEHPHLRARVKNIWRSWC
jgi:hypothetical protein